MPSHSSSLQRLSIIICTHNPREQYLKRVLSALEEQTLPVSEWELIVVDNASSSPLADLFDLSWHPAARHVREEELGLTPARLRGIAKARGDVIVFVDDDNVLSKTYLAEAVSIGERYPFLGAWGGSIDLEFEVPPPEWVLQYRSHLAYRNFSSPRWSNIKSDLESQPYGAGMCLRREVCQRYAKNVSNDKFRRSLDRKGTNLLAGGDIDLVLTASVFDYGWGNFPTLQLVHLIPTSRTKEQYLLRLREEVTFSSSIVAALNGYAYSLTPLWKHVLQRLWRRARFRRRADLFIEAERRGQVRGHKVATDYMSQIASNS